VPDTGCDAAREARGAALNSTDGTFGSAAVWVRRHPRLPLAVRVLRLGEQARPALKGASLLFVASDPGRCQPPPLDMLTGLFGLTPAEAGVAVGMHLAEIAADRGVKIGTVRAYSKIVFGKTGTRGQTELAALLTRLAFLTMAPKQKP
jgi:DNA-binding CsgD family transcriptional regulator